MEWYILYDPQDELGEFLVIADFHVLRDEKGACWKRTLDFTAIDTADNTTTSFLSRNKRLTILHKFISDNPIPYVNNFQSSHPELFI
jgi:hypothetical protein